MLAFGRIFGRGCGGVTRRELLRAGSCSALGLGLADALRARAVAADAAPRARSVILLWLWGGPSHLDTFDMKPAAPAEFRGPYRPVSTNVPGIEISELLPRLARRADRYALVRSMRHESNDHGIAGTIGLTGSSAGAISLGGQTLPGTLEPAMGAVVGRHRGFRPTLPEFVSLGGFLHQGKRRIAGEGGGRLGLAHDPFRLDYDPAAGVKLHDWQLMDGVTADGLGSLVDLRERFNELSDRLDRSTVTANLDRYYRQALSLLTSSESRKVFELDDEPDALRRRYGRFRFGQCCLIARRLVEAGVGFVQVNWSSHVEPIEDAGDGGWDTHDRNFPQLQDRHCWMLDQALSALLDDLRDRGLLESTVVIAMGEFGRSPQINARAGREHWQHCYSALLAGGGIRVGQVVGASDPRGEYPASRPTTPGDLAVTAFDLLGIRTPELTDQGLVPQGSVVEALV